MKKFAFYLTRWQMSTLILWPCVALLPLGSLGNTVVANLIGGAIFFNVDRYIFKGKR